MRNNNDNIALHPAAITTVYRWKKQLSVKRKSDLNRILIINAENYYAEKRSVTCVYLKHR